MSRAHLLLGLALLAGCSEYTVRDAPPVGVADPPGSTDEYGDPPDWAVCPSGWIGRYTNIPESHPDFAPAANHEPSSDRGALDWWDDEYLAFERYDASLDHGAGWWPVDEGIAGDPAYFAVHFRTWIKVSEAGPAAFVFGAADDAWIDVDGVTLLAQPGIKDFESQTIELDLATGQFPLEIWFAHREGESGLSVRSLSEHVEICAPE